MNLRLLLTVFALFVLSSLCSAAAEHVEAVVYKGSIGTQRIVMKLPKHPAKAKSAFFEPVWFFPRYRIDHNLDLIAASKDRLRMTSSRQEFPQWSLTRQADGSWRGTRTQSDGHAMPVLLKRAVLPPLPANASDYLRRARIQQPYVYLRLHNVKLQRGWREDFMGHTLQWWREPRSGIELFRVNDGYPAAQRRRINRVLMDELWTQINSYYSCAGAPLSGGSVEFSATPKLLSDTVVSIAIIAQYYCGGAHGGTNYSAINLDARTGRKLALGDVIEPREQGPVQSLLAPVQDRAYGSGSANTKHSSQGIAHQEAVFPSWLRTQLGALYPKRMHGGCNYAEDGSDTWTLYGWYMTTKGIFIIPYFPHVVAACTYIDDWSLLPWSWLVKQHVKFKLPLPGTSLLRSGGASVTTNEGRSKIARIKIEKAGQQSFMGFALQWWRDPVSGLRMFQIVRHGQIQQSFSRVNDALMWQLWQQLGHYYACQYSTRAMPSMSVRPTYLSTAIVSVDISISHVDTFVNHINAAQGCDGRGFIRAPITLSMDDGQRLSSSEVFDVAPNAVTPGEAERQTAHWLVKQLTAIYPERMSGIEPTCNFADPRIWLGAKWHLTPKGVFFHPDFTKAAQQSRVCATSDDWSLLPWAKLKGHMGRFKLELPESR